MPQISMVRELNDKDRRRLDDVFKRFRSEFSTCVDGFLSLWHTLKVVHYEGIRLPIVDEAEPLIRAERCVDIEYARWRMMAVGAKRHFALDHDDLGTPVDLTEFNKKLLKRTLSQKWQRLLLKWRD